MNNKEDWQIEAFRKTISYVPVYAHEYDFATPTSGLHLRNMLADIEANRERFDSGKLGRYLGWAQCVAVARGFTTLEEMKRLNKSCQQESYIMEDSEGPRTKESLEAEIKAIHEWLSTSVDIGLLLSDLYVGSPQFQLAAMLKRGEHLKDYKKYPK